MSSTFDYVDAQIIGSWHRTSVFSRIPPVVGDIVQVEDIDGVVYDAVIEMIYNAVEDYLVPTTAYLKILRVNEVFYDYVKRQYRKYKD